MTPKHIRPTCPACGAPLVKCAAPNADPEDFRCSAPCKPTNPLFLDYSRAELVECLGADAGNACADYYGVAPRPVDRDGAPRSTTGGPMGEGDW